MSLANIKHILITCRFSIFLNFTNLTLFSYVFIIFLGILFCPFDSVPVAEDRLMRLTFPVKEKKLDNSTAKRTKSKGKKKQKEADQRLSFMGKLANNKKEKKDPKEMSKPISKIKNRIEDHYEAITINTVNKAQENQDEISDKLLRKQKQKEDKKQKRKEKKTRNSSSSFYLDDSNRGYESMDDLLDTKSNISETQEVKSEPNYIDMETIEEIRLSLLLDDFPKLDHPYSAVNIGRGKPRSNTLHDSPSVSHKEFVAIRSKPRGDKRSDYMSTTTDECSTSSDYENSSEILSARNQLNEGHYVNGFTFETMKHRSPGLVRNAPARSKSLDCLLDSPKQPGNNIQGIYENSGQYRIGRSDTQDRINSSPARPTKLTVSSQRRYENNELQEQNSPGYESTYAIRRLHVSSQPESNYYNIRSPSSESLDSKLSYADIELDYNRNKTKNPVKLTSSSQSTQYTEIDFAKSKGVADAVRLARLSPSPRSPIQRNNHLTDMSHKTFNNNSTLYSRIEF